MYCKLSIKENKLLNTDAYLLPILSKIDKNQNKLSDFIDKTTKSANKILDNEKNLLNKVVEINEAIKKDTIIRQNQIGSNASGDTRTNFDAKDEKFLNEFYGKSRLHLISTLATELKLYINNLRNNVIHKEIKKLPDELFSVNANDKVILEKDEKLIFHIDIDCFFVSVSLRDKPHLWNEPVAVAHSKGNSTEKNKESEKFSFSEIASCNYEARKFGLKNGMLVGSAKRLCPNLKLIPYDFEQYSQCSKQIYELVSQYTHNIKAVSCDEMFVDFTNLIIDRDCMLNPLNLASFIRNEIKTHIKCPSSIGIGTNMLIARLATRKAKPNGHVWVRAGQESLNFLSKMEINLLPGIGSSIMSKISSKWNIKTCEELRKISKFDLQALFGNKLGSKLYEFCRGIDTRSFLDGEASNATSKSTTISENLFKKSISTDVNYGIRFDTQTQVYDFFQRLSTELCDRLKRYNLKGTKLTLKIKIRDPSAPIETKKFLGCGLCIEKTISTHIHNPTNDCDIVSQCCKTLYKNNYSLNTDCKDLRGVGLQMDKLTPATCTTLLKPSMKAMETFQISKPKVDNQTKKLENEEVILIDDEPEKTKEKSSLKDEINEKLDFIPNYECDYNNFNEKIKEILSKSNGNSSYVENNKLFKQEIDCIKFILNDWIYWSSNLNRNDTTLFNNDLLVFKGYLLHLVNYNEHLEKLEIILKLFKSLIIKYGSSDWVHFYKQVHDEVQAYFYQKNNALLDIDDDNL